MNPGSRRGFTDRLRSLLPQGSEGSNPFFRTRHLRRFGVISSLCIGVVFAAFVLSGCQALTQPTPSSAPAARTGLLKLGLAGQSNSILIRPFLEEHASVVGYGEVTAIDPCWSAQGSCWQTLQPQLHGELDAFVWWQGEMNILQCVVPDHYGPCAPTYGPAFVDLMARVRLEYAEWRRQARLPVKPDLLIVVMQMGPWAAAVGKDLPVERETVAWVKQDRNAAYIETRDLEWRQDGIHMTDRGYRDLVERTVAAIRTRK